MEFASICALAVTLVSVPTSHHMRLNPKGGKEPAWGDLMRLHYPVKECFTSFYQAVACVQRPQRQPQCGLQQRQRRAGLSVRAESVAVTTESYSPVQKVRYPGTLLLDGACRKLHALFDMGRSFNT